MRSDTRSVTIGAPAADVFAFVADAANLPRWAIGFAKHVRPQGGRWIVTTGGGDMPLDVEADDRRGTVDFHMEPAPELRLTAYSRVIPNGQECEYIFTQFQPPGVSDDMFEQLVTALRYELVALKALMEVACPL